MDIIFTAHAEYRIGKRNLTRDEVIEALRGPDLTRKKHGLYYAQKEIGRGTIEVCYEKTAKYIKVITIYWI